MAREAIGTVDFFHDRKGYGFIETEDADDEVFFHMEDIGGPVLEEGQEVAFDIEQYNQGPKAVNIRRNPSTASINRSSSSTSPNAETDVYVPDETPDSSETETQVYDEADKPDRSYCPECGCDLTDSPASNFCPNCGSSI